MKLQDLDGGFVGIDSTGAERARAAQIHRQKITDPKKWWESLRYDDDWEIPFSNILDQVETYRLNHNRDVMQKLIADDY